MSLKTVARPALEAVPGGGSLSLRW